MSTEDQTQRGVQIVERPDGAHEFRVPTAYDVDRAAVDHMIDQLLELSMRHANDATDPDTPEGHFRHHCAQSVLAAQAAHALERLMACAGSKEAASTGAEMREFGQDSEVLISWVGERLNKRMKSPAEETCGRCQRPFDPTDKRFDGAARHGDSRWCKGCIDRCHEASEFDHSCPICAI